MRPVPACYTSGRGASNVLGPGRYTISAHCIAKCIIRYLAKRRICTASPLRHHLTMPCRQAMRTVLVTSLVMWPISEMSVEYI